MKSPDSRRHSYRVAPRRPRTAESDAGDRRLGAKSEGVRDVDAGARSSGAGAFRRSSVHHSLHSGIPRSGEDDAACLVNHNYPICRLPPVCRVFQRCFPNPRVPALPTISPRSAPAWKNCGVSAPRVPPDDDARRERGPRPNAISDRPGLADRSGLSPAVRRF